MPTKIARASRVPETTDGQQGEFIASEYDHMQRHIRDQGWLQEKIDLLIDQGIDGGDVLEIGMGPGYLGLEWLKAIDSNAKLIGVDISAQMVTYAQQNCKQYSFTDKAQYRLGDALKMSFESNSFDCIFSYGSLHEWNDPIQVFSEIHRLLRPGGRYCIIDLRRDLDRQSLQFMRINIAMGLRKGLISSVRASYTCTELKSLLAGTPFAEAQIEDVPLALYLSGKKSAEH